jgi:hypothetical protein
MKLNTFFFGILFIIVSAGFSADKVKNVPEIERGSLLLRAQPKALDAFITNGKINMTYVCSVCNFLTDNDSIHYMGYVIPERKKAFARHIKHLYSKLTQAAVDEKTVDDEISEMLFELALFSESLKQKAIANANPVVSFAAKKQMFFDSRRSHKVFQYKNEITGHEAANVNPSDLQEDPADSPFWHKPIAGIEPNERFDHLARLKKIKPQPHMVVIFDEPSLSGSAPKIDVQDTDLDNGWSMKWGDEVHTDPVGSRIFAALGYDVDHPYYFGRDAVTLIFDGMKTIKNAEQLKAEVKRIYHIDLTPFISYSGIVTAELILANPELKSFSGKAFVRFVECSLEARPDRVKRIGSFVPYLFSNEDRRELRGALLAHAFIGNWDTREANTLFTSVHMGNYKYRMSAVFSDLGTSFGVSYGILPADFKVGLVNEFPWEVATNKNGTISLNNAVNALLPCYKKATYNDLLWMAKKIAALDGPMLRNMVAAGRWPEPIEELFYQKLASRRASILKAFNLPDEHPIAFDKNFNQTIFGVEVIKNGKLVVDHERKNNPESFLFTKGRFRNYGN